ncbi:MULTISPECIES: hypothetical protein [Bacillus]|uniref:hypothetical protein n=1 Tax=Bacillus TaxID=1386 RepID=UPI000E5103FD|nr:MULTISPECIES: hypothetical protein [Bacillus subtilis group]MBT3123408.1 hypothetical protein [Bacillus inaquosorum]MCB4338011.1 hypothetical protein [Bacillus subtilis]MCB5337113.1 hypothetical protein [Bacillus amyloliquefaciens]MCF7615444.1 hypothetical protein [Bacillus subtilis]MCL9628238.1 hypothetical protein [Bacillus subtilis]
MYKFLADWKGVVVDYNPTYRKRKDTGIQYMLKKIAETQKFANGMFNKPVTLFVYQKINGAYKEIEVIEVPETMEL